MNASDLPANRYCSIAQSLEVLGQKWTLLILREAHRGRNRFADFRAIGVPTDVLTDRLNLLVADGVLERQRYQDPGERARDMYVLTQAGQDLLPILASLAAWGDAHRPSEGTGLTKFFDAAGNDVTLSFVSGGTPVSVDDVHMEYAGQS
ncbi:winged helix-turn-helix transcriptional regulator [Mesorhizobium japonicum]|uniref:winged helix-turn-helix transcriptional regulator n=1 Tax=Mesorhizobium japonicum TaxID=2066070 RepID=UPI003B5AB847